MPTEGSVPARISNPITVGASVRPAGPRTSSRRRRQRVAATRDALAEAESPDETEREDEISGDAEDDETAVGRQLRDRTPDDLAWELAELDKLVDRVSQLTAMPSKLRPLLRVLENRRAAGNRVRQIVVFTRFKDTLDDVVRRLREIDYGLLIGTYSGQGGRYVDPDSRDWVGVERDEVKHRFLRRAIDILVCTDAATEGRNLQSADLLINYDPPWNPMKVEQRIGRIDRIGQQHEKVYVLNLCYAGSAEDIVYGRLLARAAQARRRSMEIPPQDLCEIYERLDARAEANPPPVTLDDIWLAIGNSPYLRSLGCRVLPDETARAAELKHIPGAPEGCVLTASRDVYERGLPGIDCLRFASYGDPAFEGILGLTAAGGLPPGIQRVGVPIPATDGAELVGYVVMRRDQHGVVAPYVILSFRAIEGIDIDAEAPVPAAAVESLTAGLAARAREEFRVLAAARTIEELNEKAAHAQRRPTYLVAKSFVLSVQRAHRGEANFARQLAVLDEIVERSAEQRLARLPVDQLLSVKGVPFQIQLPAAGSETHYDAPRPLLRAAVDLAAGEADALHRRPAEVTTEQVLARL